MGPAAVRAAATAVRAAAVRTAAVLWPAAVRTAALWSAGLRLSERADPAGRLAVWIPVAECARPGRTAGRHGRALRWPGDRLAHPGRTHRDPRRDPGCLPHP